MYLFACVSSVFLMKSVQIFGPFFKMYFLLFVYSWLCWSSLLCMGFSSCGEWGLSSSCGRVGFSCGGSRAQSTAPGVVAQRLSHLLTCGILPDQGSNPCPLHWQVDSWSLDHQGSPGPFFILTVYFLNVKFWDSLYFSVSDLQILTLSFILLTVSFEEKRLLILIKSDLQFFFYNYTFGVLSKKSLLNPKS